MNTKSNIIRLMLAIVLLVSLNNLVAQDFPNTNWNQLNKKLVTELKSDDTATKISAMSKIIHYGNNVDVGEAKYEILHTFLTDQNQANRQIALIALYKIGTSLDLDIIENQLRYEQNPTIRKRIVAILRDTDRLNQAHLKFL